MRKPFPVLLLLLGTAVFAAAAAHIGSSKTPDSDPIARLNDCIQRRFLDRKAFGMSRILPYQYHGIRQFQPENGTEQHAIIELTQQGYQVVLFLAGRHVLDSQPQQFASPRYGVQGPAFIAGITDSANLPATSELLTESRKAMLAFDKQDGYDVRRGDWTIAMRPFRASNGACVQCHASRDGNGPKLGDALGVAMYVYRLNADGSLNSRR